MVIKAFWQSCKLTGLFFWKLSVFADMISQISSRHQINHEVQIITILKSIVHIDQESNKIEQLILVGNQKIIRFDALYLRMHKLTEELLLVHDWVNATLRDYSRLRHFFHRKQFLFFAELYLPHFAESTSSNDIVKVEVILVDFYSQVTKRKRLLEQASKSSEKKIL